MIRRLEEDGKNEESRGKWLKEKFYFLPTD